jgi:hypothetical protein
VLNPILYVAFDDDDDDDHYELISATPEAVSM